MRSVLIEYISDVFHQVDRITAIVGLDMRRDFQLIPVRGIQKIRHHRVGVIVGVWRRPRNDGHPNAGIPELSHVQIDDLGIKTAVGSEIRVIIRPDVGGRRMRTLGEGTFFIFLPARKIVVIPVTPKTVVFHRSIPGIVEDVNVVVGLDRNCIVDEWKDLANRFVLNK